MTELEQILNTLVDRPPSTLRILKAVIEERDRYREELEAAHAEADECCARYRKCHGYPTMTLTERVRDICVQVGNLRQQDRAEAGESSRLQTELDGYSRLKDDYSNLGSLLDQAQSEFEYAQEERNRYREGLRALEKWLADGDREELVAFVRNLLKGNR